MASGWISGLEANSGLEAKKRRFPILLLGCLEAAAQLHLGEAYSPHATHQPP
jgi:hypothetical protein